MLSRFFHSTMIENNKYAIYNSLLMDILYVTYDELLMINSCSIQNELDVDTLYKAGIYVSSPESDEKALTALRNRAKMNLGIIDIMYLITTQNCNLKCSYCFLENNTHRNQRQTNLSTENAQKAIYKFANLIMSEGRSNGTIIFYGGEPLLNKRVFYDSVLYALTFPISWSFSIITNGTLLDEEAALFCKKYNISVGLSIDGPKVIHDYNRRFRNNGQSSYEACMKSQRLLEQHNCNYGLSMTLSQDVLQHKEIVFNWLIENYKGDVFFNLLHFSSKKEFDSTYISEATQFLIDFFELCEKDGFSIKEQRIQRQIDSFVKQEFVFSDCGAVGCHQITVLPNGQLCICHGDSVNKNLCWDDIKSIDLTKIVKSCQGKEWYDISTLNDEDCLNCPAIFICGRGCPHHAESVWGSKRIKEPNYCEYVKGVLAWLLSRGITAC